MINKGYYCELLEELNRVDTTLTALKIVKMYIDSFEDTNKLYEYITMLRLDNSRSKTLLSQKICEYCDMVLNNIKNK